MLKNPDGVSIIICCFNSALLLKQTLLHIKRQVLNGINCEVILVDNASTDDTDKIAAEVWGNDNNAIKLTIINEPQPGLAYARKAGIKQASYEYLVFCDDDNWLDADYAYNAFTFFNNNPQAAVLGGLGFACFENETQQPAWFQQFYQSYAVGAVADEEKPVNSVYGAGMAVRRSVLIKIMETPLFLHGRKQNQLTSGEDSEICYRMRLAGHQVFYTPLLKFKHYLLNKRLTWAYVKRLHSGLAKSHVVLNLYEHALLQDKPALPNFYWLKKAAYYTGIYLKYWPKHFKAYNKREGTVEELRHIMWKDIALSYLHYHVTTKSIYKSIVSLKSNG